MNIYTKLQQARDFIKGLNMEKKGYNNYSKYKYYTPEQINELVYRACKETGLLTKFDLIRDENGLHGILTIIDPVNDKDMHPEITFKQATDIPQIKATNITQQIGGAVTYTHRYLLMTAFDIVENDLDFDSKIDKSAKATDDMLMQIESLIHTSSIDEKKKTTIESEMYTYDITRAEKCIAYLNDNQIESENPSQAEIQEKLKDINSDPKK